MTRRHYVMLAAALKAARDAGAKGLLAPTPHYLDGCDRSAQECADALAADNPRFDRARFLKAAGVAP